MFLLVYKRRVPRFLSTFHHERVKRGTKPPKNFFRKDSIVWKGKGSGQQICLVLNFRGEPHVLARLRHSKAWATENVDDHMKKSFPKVRGAHALIHVQPHLKVIQAQCPQLQPVPRITFFRFLAI